MFLVSEKIEDRENRIRSFLESDHHIAVLLAAIHFEWTVRRVMIALSKSPNREIRKEMVFGIKRYKEFWNKHVNEAKFSDVIGDYDELNKKYQLRNKLIHGEGGFTKNNAISSVETILKSAQNIITFSKEKGFDVNSKLPVRR